MVLHKGGVTPPARVPSIVGADVYLIAGQSNACGQASRYSICPSAGLFGNDYRYKQLRDPIDSIVGQVDAVNKETAIQYGSVWPLFAEALAASSGHVVYFVPCALGGSGIADWQPGADHQNRATLYGSLVYRALQVQAAGGTLKVVLFWGGEHDVSLGTSQATYNSGLDTFANTINSDLGIRVMPCKLQNCTGLSAPNQVTINAAITEAWGNNANVLTGPDLSGIATDDASHLIGDAKNDSAAALWLAAIETAFGW